MTIIFGVIFVTWKNSFHDFAQFSSSTSSVATIIFIPDLPRAKAFDLIFFISSGAESVSGIYVAIEFSLRSLLNGEPLIGMLHSTPVRPREKKY